MTTSILVTKLFIPPRRPELVTRPRLTERLDQGLQRKLSLISAPAGFGKTTLVSEWVHHLQSQASKDNHNECCIAWLSLDEGDNDPARFLSYLISALMQVEAIEPARREGLLGVLQTPQPPAIQVILTTVINQMTAVPGRIILVLDDYHLIDSSQVDAALTFLLERLPQQMHLLIATREDPQLPLPRLRVRGQLTELRAADLRFTLAEAAEFLNEVMGLALSEEDIAALEKRTEGWIAGLQLAAISMQGFQDHAGFIQSFTGGHRLVLDFLIEEVLEQQPESVQTFLLKTSILNQLTGSLCDTLTDQNNGQSTLEMLDRANLFLIPLDNERRWYRYHHLFADLLHQRLRQTQPDWIERLHHRASEWYKRNGFIDEAIDHALRAEDFERATYLLEEHIDEIWQRGEQIRLRRWQAALPAELLYSKPRLCILHAWFLLIGGQLDAAEQSLQAAEGALDHKIVQTTEISPLDQNLLPGTGGMTLRGRIAAIRALIATYRGDVPGTIQYARQAKEYLPEQDLKWRSVVAIALGDAYDIKSETAAASQARVEASRISWAAGDIYLSMIANLKLAVTLRTQGQLQQVIEICRQQLQIADQSGMSHIVVVGWLLAIWGEALAELNDLDEAINHVKRSVDLTKQSGDVAMLGWSYLCLIRVLFSTGDVTGAEEIIHKLENIVREHDVPSWMTGIMAAWQAWLWLAQDKLDAASQWVEERRLSVDGEPTVLREMEYIVFARILIAQGRLNETIRLLQRLLEVAEAGGRTSKVIEILMLQALAFQAGGSTDQAILMLEQALTLAEPGGFVRIFVDEGPPMAHLLYEALNRRIAPDYVRRLLAVFPIDEPEQTRATKVQSSEVDLIEPLSEREIEVLQLIGKGQTNQEIASRLYLSLNTVKVHTRNIHRKLGVHNRTQAVARARALGILPPI